MINQPSVTHYRYPVMLKLEIAAKLKMLIRNKTAEARPYINRNNRKMQIKMTMSRYIEQLVEEAVKDVVLDVEARRWMFEQKGRMVIRRQEADALVKSGINRKPRSEWLKPGRVAGKDYGDTYAPWRYTKNKEKGK